MRRLLTLSLLTLIALAAPARAEDPPAAPAPDGLELSDPANRLVLIKTSMGDITAELFTKQAPVTVATFAGLANGTKAWTDPETQAEVKRPFYDGLIFHRVIDGFMIQGGCPLGTGVGGAGFDFKDEINAEALGLDEIKALRGQSPHPWLGITSQQQFQQRIVIPLLGKLGYPPIAELSKLPQSELQKIEEDIKTRLPTLTLKDAYELGGYQYSRALASSPPKRGVLAMANSGPNTNSSQFFITLADVDHLTGKHTVFGKVLDGFDVVQKIGKVKTGAQDRPVEPVTIVSIREIPK